MEYIVLTHDSEILGVFQSLQDCLLWKPPSSLEGPIVAHRVRALDSGQFKIQKIILSNTIFETNQQLYS